MADERLEVSLLSLGNGFLPALECHAGHLFDSEQRKLNEAAFKLDQLSQELDSMRSTPSSPAAADHAQQEAKTFRKDGSVSTPTALNMYSSSKPESQTYTPQPAPLQPSSPYTFDPMPPPVLYQHEEQHAQPDRAPSPRPLMAGPPMLYSPQGQPAQPDRAPSPRPLMSRPPMLYLPQGQHAQPDRAPSPRPLMSGPPMLYSPQGQHTQPDRAPSPRPMMPAPPSSYTGPCYLADPFPGISPRESVQPLLSAGSWAPAHTKPSREAEDILPGGRLKTYNPGTFNANTGDTLKNKKAASVWAEADLDVAYEKKPSRTPSYENKREPNWNTAMQGGSWRQTDLDLAVLPNKAAGGQSKKYDSIQIYGTLPKSINNPHPPPKRHNAYTPKQMRPAVLGAPQVPWSWPNAPAPIPARSTFPPGSPRASPIKERRNVLPLSVLIGPAVVSSRERLPAPARLLPAHARLPPGHAAVPTARRYPQDVGRPVSDSSPLPSDAKCPPLSPAETGEVEPELVSIFRQGEAAGPESVPRPLSPTRLLPVSLPDTEAIQDMEELLRIRAAIPRALKKRTSIDQPAAQLLPLQKRTRMYQQLTKFFVRGTQKRQQELSEDVASSSSPVDSPRISPASDSELTPVLLPPVVESLSSVPLKRSILKQDSWPGTSKKIRARLDPLVLLLDAALLGELDVVERVVSEMSDPSQSNAEGITGLHNAVCGGHYDVVEFLVNFGVNVNAPDSYGWTPLHCAASCNDLPICTLLVRKGAAIFSMTLSDGDTAAEKCDRYLDGYEECARFLFSAEQQAGMMNNAVVYALWDYEAENSDELSFREGETITILQRGDREESSWWWASLYGREGYVPYNFLGLFPRVRPLV